MISISLQAFSFVLKGFSGKKVSYTSLPYKFIIGFTVESAGIFTAKATMYTSKAGGKGKHVIQFRKKDMDMFEINNLLASKIL